MNGLHLSYKKFQVELGKRLREIRVAVFHNRSPEDISADMAARGLEVAPKTIRDWEKGVSSPTLEKLWAILEFYGISLGDFFRFTITSEEGRMLGDFVPLLKDERKRKLLKTLLELFDIKQS